MIRLEFRLAQNQDVEAVVGLVNSAYRGESSRRGWTTEADLLGGQRTDAREITSLLRPPDSLLVLGYGDGQLLACFHLQHEHAAVSLGLFAIDPRRQGEGLGRQCLSHAESLARQRWLAGTMRMTVISERSELIAYYQRKGYELTGEREPFPMRDERFGLPKVEHLEFVVLEKPLAETG